MEEGLEILYQGEEYTQEFYLITRDKLIDTPLAKYCMTGLA